MKQTLSTIATKPYKKLFETWWYSRHLDKIEQSKSKEFKAVFIGDSIFQKFETDGKNAWLAFKDHDQYLNLGFNGDSTEHVLWRLKNNALRELNTSKIVLLIGTNNAGIRFDSSEDTVLGIQAIIDEIRKQIEDCQIIVLGLLPRSRNSHHKFRIRNNEVNTLLHNYCLNKVHLNYLDISKSFMQADGFISKEIMPDALHLSEQGYKILVSELKKILEP